VAGTGARGVDGGGGFAAVFGEVEVSLLWSLASIGGENYNHFGPLGLGNGRLGAGKKQKRFFCVGGLNWIGFGDE